MICSLNSRTYHLKENTRDNAKNDKIAFIVTRGEEESCDATGPFGRTKARPYVALREIRVIRVQKSILRILWILREAPKSICGFLVR